MKKRFITSIFLLIFFISLMIVPGKLGFIFTQVSSIILAELATLELIHAFYPNQFSQKVTNFLFPIIQQENKVEDPKPHKLHTILVIFTSVMVILYFLIVKQLNPQSIVGGTFITPGLEIDYSTLLLSTLLVLFLLFIFLKDVQINDIGKVLFIIFYAGIGFSSITLLRLWGTKFLVYCMLLSILADTSAFVFGSLFGKHKFSPYISPKKTWEGALGGVITASLIGTLFSFFYGSIFNPSYTGFWGEISKLVNSDSQISLLSNFSIIRDNFSPVQEFFLNLLISFAGCWISVFGDLFASKIKRQSNIKDFGKIFPGHGGVLDRFDSMIFVSTFLGIIFLIFSNF